MATSEKRLFLLDGMALVYRAHFALIRNPIYNSKGMNTSTVFGFLNTLLEILENRQPSHLCVAFDTKEPTPRHEIFPEYKAQRDAMPEDLATAIPIVKKVLQAFKISVIEIPGYEADDIIGTLAYKADQEGTFHTYMVTPDKDFAQLVSEKASILKPGRKGAEAELLNVSSIQENWGINHPKQVIDVLALWGDASDNIPGIPGIGEKTAKKLIHQFGSVEALLESTDQLKGKQKENIENNKQQALLSKQLTTIILDAPVNVSFDEIALKSKDNDALKLLFTELEFNSLGKRLFGADFQSGRGHTTTEKNQDTAKDSAILKTFSDVKTNYISVSSPKELTKVIKSLNQQDLFCFDLETTSLNPRVAEILGIALSWKANQAYYITPSAELSIDSILDALRVPLTSKATKIGHNLKYDLSVLLAKQIETAPPFFDTMLAHALVEPDHRHTMDYLAESLLGYSPIKLSQIAENIQRQDQKVVTGDDDLFSLAEKRLKPKPSKKKPQEINMSQIPPEALTDYACEDADITFQLASILADRLESSGQSEVFYDIESPLLPVLVRMEQEGISVQLESLAMIGESLANKLDSLTSEIYTQAGKEFNLNSPKQLGDILFGEMQLIDNPKKTKTGQFKTDESTLSLLAPKHPIIAKILEYREAAKLKSTYVDALPEHICPSDDRVHTQLHQLITATGRLASSNPNLQNIPIRSETGREIRKAFVPRSHEYTLLACDYSQIELRVMAAIAGDQSMISAFQQDLDIHTATAARVYGVELGDVTREMRSTAKMVNFGIIYGISAFGLSQRLNISRSESAEIIESYFKQYPAIKSFMDSTMQQAEQDGFVTTLGGRRRTLRDINSRNGMIRKNAERAAINTPVQGTGADMIKLAMVKVDQLLQQGNYRTKMILQVHDELIFDLALDEEDTLIPLIVDAMESALSLPHDVPTKVEFGTGRNWLDAH